MHHTFVGWFLSRLPSDGRVVDTACGTGKYFPMVLASGRRLVGVDHAGALLANAAAKFPQVPTAKHDLQELPYQGEFDGVRGCHGVRPTGGLATGPGALPPGSAPTGLAVSDGRARPRRSGACSQPGGPPARASGGGGRGHLGGPDGYYHHYPSMQRVRTWLADAVFTIDEEAEGPGTRRSTPTTMC
jgi:SAM-dependent methyltransferase